MVIVFSRRRSGGVVKEGYRPLDSSLFGVRWGTAVRVVLVPDPPPGRPMEEREGEGEGSAQAFRHFILCGRCMYSECPCSGGIVKESRFLERVLGEHSR